MQYYNMVVISINEKKRKKNTIFFRIHYINVCVESKIFVALTEFCAYFQKQILAKCDRNCAFFATPSGIVYLIIQKIFYCEVYKSKNWYSSED